MSDEAFFSSSHPIDAGTYSNTNAQPLTREVFMAALARHNEESRRWPPPPRVYVVSPASLWSIAKFMARHPSAMGAMDIDAETMTRAREWWRRRDMRRSRMSRKKRRGWA